MARLLRADERRSGTLLPAAVFLLGLCAAAAAGLWLRENNASRAAAAFEHSVERVADEISRRYRQPVDGLNGIRGLYAVNGRITRLQFDAYFRARDLRRDFPGVRGFGFVERVLRANVDAFVAAERADLAPQFALRQLGDSGHEDLYVIKHLEPAAGNAGAVGLDLGSERNRREAVLRAIVSGQPTMSAPVTLVQDKHSNPGALLFLPVFANGADPADSVERSAFLVGLAYAPLVTAELLEGVEKAVAGEVNFALFDVTGGSPGGTLIHGNDAPREVESGPAPPEGRHFSAVRALSMLGREFTLRVNSTPRFDAAQASSLPWTVFVGGALSSLLLSLLVRQQATGRRRAEQLARDMTADLDRLVRVVKYTKNLALLTDREMRIIWANDAFTTISGFTLEDALGKTPGELVGNLHADPAAVRTLADSAAAGTGCRVEILNRSKDGRDYWVDIEVEPMLDAEGRLTGFMEFGIDITQRRRAEAELRASRALLDRTGRIAGVGGWTLEFATQATTYTDQTCRIHDLPPGHQPTLKEALGYFPPEVQPRIQQALQESMATGASVDLELPLITAGGRAIWVRVVGQVEFEEGRPLRVSGAMQDITVRRALESELRSKNELMAAVMENLPCGLSVFDDDLRLVTANGQYRHLLELPDELFDQPVVRYEDIIRFNAVHGRYGEENVAETVQAVLARARVLSGSHPFEIAHRGGRVLEVRRGALPGGGTVTTYVDISARRRAEAEVQHGAQLLRAAIDAIDEAFVLYDPEDRMVFCNDKYRSTYAASSDVMVPGNTFEHIVRTGAERGQYRDAVGRVDEWVAERVAAHRTDSAVVVQKLYDGRTLRIIERRMPSGHTVGFRVDISEMVRATEAAQEARSAAEAATTAKSRFLANMSHEIRTPMNAILGMLALLRKTELTVRQADYAAKTEGAARSLLVLLNDILDFSKVEAGKMTLDPRPFRIEQLLCNLSTILGASVGTKRLEVLFDVGPGMPQELIGDAMRLQQVLINLCGNAIKFTEKGEVVLSLRVTGQGAGTVEIEFAVRDTGIGIAPEHHARVFSGFTQAEASTTRRYGGTGLGVAISQRLIGLMGGELGLESVVGEGSCFHFRLTLPVADGVSDEGPAIAAPDVPLRALIVDDNPTAREVLVRMGHSLGWTIEAAESGEHALEILCTQAGAGIRFDVVFVDWQMPGWDGWETCRRIRDSGLPEGAPVVVMVTANGREMLAQRTDAEQALLDGFLIKPVTASMLIEAVAEARSEQGPGVVSRGGTATDRRLAGMRLLLVEDNLNNQQVAREMLEDEGAVVQIANNGREAVEAVAAVPPRFDVVLMDLQMPVMDGFAATRSIRKDLALTELPIVAMTANALAADREECLAAGMNDHVGKPFDLDALVRVLCRHTGRVPVAARNPAPVPAATALSGEWQAAAAAGVDLGAAIGRMGGKQDLYLRVLDTFVRDLEAMPAQLAAHLARGETTPAARLLHTLKGLAATLGANALSAAAAGSEQALAGEAAPGLATGAVAGACAAIVAAAPGLRALLAALQASPPAAVLRPAAALAAPAV